TRGAPGERHTPRGKCFSGTGQRVFALRAGPVVREADAKRAKPVVPLCGRLCVLLRLPTRGRGVRGGAGRTDAEIRLGTGGGQNETNSFWAVGRTAQRAV